MGEAARPPCYLSRASLARELDMAESTIDALVRDGVLPKPIRARGCVRWRWSAVEKALASLEPTADNQPLDPYIAGALNATEEAGAGRG